MELSQTGAFSIWIERSGFELWDHCIVFLGNILKILKNC